MAQQRVSVTGGSGFIAGMMIPDQNLTFVAADLTRGDGWAPHRSS
jgi:hypothetical protein